MYADLPFRNIRDVLGLHAKTTPHKNFLVYYDAEGKRHEYSYAIFTAMVHQTANLLYEDLKVQRGDVIAVAGRMHPHLLAIEVACWLVGATVIPIVARNQSIHEYIEPEYIYYDLRDSGARIAFADSEWVAADFQQYVNKIDTLEGMIQVGGERRDDILLFAELANNRPTSFLGDDIGAKGADVPLKAGDERTARLNDVALKVMDKSGMPVTQGEVLAGARGAVEAHNITGGTVLLQYDDAHEGSSLIQSVLPTLYAGASLVFFHHSLSNKFWEIVARERVHVALFDAGFGFEDLLNLGIANQTQGKRLFGANVMRQDIKQFRHIQTTYSNKTPHQEVVSLYGFPIILTAYSDVTAGIFATIPITLDWQSQQAILAQEHPTLSLVRGYEIEIREGNKIFVRGNGIYEWTDTDCEGTWNEETKQLTLFVV